MPKPMPNPAVENMSDLQQLEQMLKNLSLDLKALQMEQRFAALGPERIFEFLYGDKRFKMYLPFGNNDRIQREILGNFTFYEARLLHLIEEYMPPGSVVVDAGANIGNHTVFFAGVCGAGQVYSFEPLRETFRLLERNINLNALHNVRPINAALGAQPGYATLKAYNPKNIGGSSLGGSEEGDYRVTTIDKLDLQRLDFIKIDVEGSHLAVLQGANETIKRCHPLIWVELRGAEFLPGDQALKALGYRQEIKLSSSNYVYKFKPGGRKAELAASPA